MSHFSNIKTQFQNLFYLEKALNRLNIAYKKKLVYKNLDANVTIHLSTRDGVQLSTKNDAKFSWNGEAYTLLADKMFWKPTYSTESFVDEISQQYAGEAIIRESQIMGLQPVDYLENSDRSNTLVVEQYKIKGQIYYA